MKLLGALLSLVCMAAACAQSIDPSPIEIAGGLVQGIRERDVVAYKGIPFAEPPVGELRWRPPRPLRVWKGVLKTREYKPQCMQVGPPLPTMPVEPVSEDCLYLNVWVPAEPAQPKLPVMVYLHGGAFRVGSPSTPLYWGHKLASTHQVITVNLAYRVGPLGFLVHPQLSAESEHQVSGNYGLLDMIAGLRWVQENIALFGGDPDNVTVFAHSAGAWALSKLMISPLTDGLFHAAIAQSGGDMGPTRTPEGLAVLRDAEKSGVAFVATLGAQSIDELRKLPAARIASASFDGLPEIPHSNAALPIMDGYVIPDGSFADEFLALYPAQTEAESARSQVRLAAESSFGWQMWAWARAHAKTSKRKVFFYWFSGTHNGHGAELPYVFLYEFGGGWSAHQRDIGAKISKYWTNFAKSGDPNGPGLPPWPAFDVENQRVMYLGERFEAGPMPDLAEHVLMERYMSSLR